MTKLSLPRNKNQWGKAWLALSLAWDLGWTIALPVVIFTLIGDYIDKLQGTAFVFRFLGGLLGIGVGVYLVYRKAKKIKAKINNFDSEAIARSQKTEIEPDTRQRKP